MTVFDEIFEKDQQNQQLPEYQETLIPLQPELPSPYDYPMKKTDDKTPESSGPIIIDMA